MSQQEPVRVTIYTGPRCCLCDRAKEAVGKVAKDVPLTLETIDIHSDPALFERYRYAIPVVAIDGKVVMAGRVTEVMVRQALRGEPLAPSSLQALEPPGTGAS